MKIRSAGATHVGKVRSTNEDYLGGFDDLALYVVADGMGGHAAGEVASRMAVEIIHAVFHTALSDRTEPNTAPTAPGHRLVRAIEQANERILSAGRDDPTLSGMGTTVAAIWIAENTAYVGHVGDSRVYRLRSGLLEQLTSDHSLINDYLARGIMTPDEAVNHPMKHVLIRALGTGPSVIVDLLAVELEPADLFLLCSDGLSNVVPPSELASILHAPDIDISLRCQGLIEAANRNGGLDNITAVLVEASEPG